MIRVKLAVRAQISQTARAARAPRRNVECVHMHGIQVCAHTYVECVHIHTDQLQGGSLEL